MWADALAACVAVVFGGAGLVGLVAVGTLVGMEWYDSRRRAQWARMDGPRL